MNGQWVRKVLQDMVLHLIHIGTDAEPEADKEEAHNVLYLLSWKP